jgi:hypothetical protein
MPLDRLAVKKSIGYLLRGLRRVDVAAFGLGRTRQLYGIHTSAISEFEACGPRVRDPRLGRELQLQEGAVGERVQRRGWAERAPAHHLRGLSGALSKSLG